jgi:small GTP-binding protein
MGNSSNKINKVEYEINSLSLQPDDKLSVANTLIVKGDDFDNSYDNTFKIVLIGSTKSGKTSLCHCLNQQPFEEEVEPTLTVDFSSVYLQREGCLRVKKLQIWDRTSNPAYDMIVKSYVRGALAVIIMFDLSDLKSFEFASDYIEKYPSYDPISIILVGNKSDLTTEVPKRQIALVCASFHREIPYCEISVKQNKGIDNLLNVINTRCVEKDDTNCVK